MGGGVSAWRRERFSLAAEARDLRDRDEDEAASEAAFSAVTMAWGGGGGGDPRRGAV